MSEHKVWMCKFGVPGAIELPRGFDAVPRDAVTKAVTDALGIDGEECECFSGWGGRFTRYEIAIIGNEDIPICCEPSPDYLRLLADDEPGNATISTALSGSADKIEAQQAEIAALKARVEELEARVLPEGYTAAPAEAWHELAQKELRLEQVEAAAKAVVATNRKKRECAIAIGRESFASTDLTGAARASLKATSDFWLSVDSLDKLLDESVDYPALVKLAMGQCAE